MRIASFHSFTETRNKSTEAIRWATMSSPQNERYYLLIDMNLSAPDIRYLAGLNSIAEKSLNDYLQNLTGRYRRTENIKKYMIQAPNNSSLYFMLPNESIKEMEKISKNLLIDIEADVIIDRLKEIFEWCEKNNFEKIIINCPSGINLIFKQMIRLTEQKIINQIIIICSTNDADTDRREEFKRLYPNIPVIFKI